MGDLRMNLVQYDYMWQNRDKEINDGMIQSINQSVSQPIILPPIESKHKMSDLISTDMSPFVLSSLHPCIYVSKLLALSDFLQVQV